MGRERKQIQIAVTKDCLHSCGLRRFDFFYRIGNEQEVLRRARKRTAIFL